MKNKIPVNIWDDYYEDGYVPEGEIQETYMYVEDYKIPEDKTKEYLEELLPYIKQFTKPNVESFLFYYDSKLKYPQLVGTENEFMLFTRWEIRLKHLTHADREELLNQLKNSNLEQFRFYSES